MLRVQLCPQSELENRSWWLPDLVVLLLVGLISWLGASYAIDSLKTETQEVVKNTANWTSQSSKIQPLVAKFKGLDNEVNVLSKKIAALQQININGAGKILPIVVTEQLQTIRPEGVWFHSIALNEERSLIVTGASSDSLLISEFLLSLRETMNPETTTTDIRSQIGFEKISLKEIKDQISDPGFSDLKNILMFDMKAQVTLKPLVQQPAPVASIPLGRSKKGSMF
jgi:hypothetical protein